MKSRRAEGMGELVELASRLEGYYSDRGTYATATLGDGSTDTDVYLASTEGGYYNLNIPVQDAIVFTITATPEGSQAKDKCGTLTLTSNGEKSARGGSDCWKN